MKKFDPKTWKIEGMSCVNCALGIEKYLKQQGIEVAKVNFASQEMLIADEMSVAMTEKIETGIQSLGFSIRQIQDDDETFYETDPEAYTPLFWRILICSILTLPLLLAMFLSVPFLQHPAVQLALCLPVQIIGWEYYGRRAGQSLKLGILNMDILIFIGSSAAFCYSLIGMSLANAGGKYLFFETAATIITIVLIGTWIERQAVRQTTSAIRDLMKLKVHKAKKIEKVGALSFEEISIKNIRKGDYLLIHTGDRIGVDCRIVEGEGSVDEAAITGESDWVVKKKGDLLLAGSMLNEGPLQAQVLKESHESTLAQIISLVKQAQLSKPPIQRLADKISAVFIPLVLLLSVATFFLNYFFLSQELTNAFMRAIAVLVVACPCAMGLATPLAVMVGAGRISRLGVLVKGGHIIEQMSKIRHILMDKTGTITTGKFRIKNAETTIAPDVFKSIIKTLETTASHPIAQSIVENLKGIALYPLQEIKEIKGRGMMGKDEEGNTYSLGSYQTVKHLTKEDAHQLYLLRNNQLIGWLDLEDEIRLDMKEGIAQLRNANIQTSILSGDREEKVREVANLVGVKDYFYEKMPQEKLAIIEEFKTKKGLLAMLGDGINDAPALAAADIGISIGAATDVAINAADIVLINANLENLLEAIKIGKLTRSNIRQNLFWAFLYNILMIPLAMFGLLNPMFAALAMALSDIVVIGNTIRLKYQKT